MDEIGEAEVLDRRDGAVLWVVLNRPHRGNAITPAQRERVITLLGEASSAPDLRAVVIMGAGKNFCTGADLTVTPQPADAAPGKPSRPVGFTARVARDGVQRLVSAVLDCEVPVIAAVSGAAAGVGMHLALACDFVIAADSARFIEVSVRRGLVPDGAGAWLLPRLVGMQRAKELMMLGEDVPSARAERLGLVNSVVPAAELTAAARDLAVQLAQGPSAALALTKRLLNQSFESDRGSALDAEATAVELVRATSDAQEGIEAFLERRQPRFRGW